MKNALLVVVAVLLSVAVQRLIGPAASRAGDESPADPVAERLERLEERLAAQQDLGTRIDALGERLAASEDAARLVVPADDRTPVGELEALVEAALDRRLESVDAVATAALAGRAEDDVSAGGLTREDFFARLASGLSGNDVQALWEEAREAGLVDEIMDVFEERAKNAPDDAQAQADLGNAYLQKLFGLADGPAKGMVASMADKAFDRALALDDQHWEARYSKAVSLSFWPPVFGKQAEAIEHFEVLVEQQQNLVPEPQHATSHLWLGNLYEQLGKGEEAQRAWTTGLELFPQNEELRKKLNSGTR